MRLIPLVLLVLSLPAPADPGLRDRLKDAHAEGEPQWIYNDLAAGFAKAKESGKPLFVTFRCVPCRKCMEFDALVAKENEAIKRLAEQFVAVRQVEMKGVDLSQFQFDYDLNWAAMFLNADGTVYARYGTQSEEGADAYNSVESLLATMKRVLDLHEDYPANRVQLVGKRGEKRPYRTALEMPGLPNRERFRQQTELNNCIHCHNIHDAEMLGAYDAGTYSLDLLWRYPYPQNIGVEVDRDHGRRIERVAKGSAWEAAGVQQGDEVHAVEGQVITSIADIQWALHNLDAERRQVQVVVHREGKPIGVTVPLREGWRKTDISWRGSLWSTPPRLRIWLPEPDENEARRHGLPDGTPAVVARWINTGEEGGRVAAQAGLQTGDLIIEVDGKPVPRGGGAAFSTFVKLNYRPGQELPLTVLRDGKRVKINVPLVK